MLPAKRRARIIEILRRERITALADLAVQVGASVSTTRRDVEYLCDSGHLTRTHGGAMLNESGDRGREPESAISTELESTAKTLIGIHAAGLIQSGQTVIFDSGTTTAACARAVIDRNMPLIAMTNDLAIAALLSRAPHIECHLPAGRVRSGSDTLIGATCSRDVSRIRADIAFVGAHAVSRDGLSDTSIELAEVKSTIVQAAETVILLADSSKLDRRSFCRFASLNDIHRVVTDNRATAEMLEAFSDHGVPVDLVA